MSEGGGDIIIKSGSVILDFDDTLYPKRQNDPKKHENENRKVTKIIIVETVNGEEKVIFHSGEHPGGLKWDTHFFTR